MFFLENLVLIFFRKVGTHSSSRLRAKNMTRKATHFSFLSNVLWKYSNTTGA